MSIPATLHTTATVPLKFEITNHAKNAIHVLTWNTPIEGFFGNYLRIARLDGELAGGEIAYGGAMMKRGTPERADYARVKPNRALTKIVNLAEVYQFNRGGRYRVAFIGQLFDVTTANIPRAITQHKPLSIVCPEIEFEITAKD